MHRIRLEKRKNPKSDFSDFSVSRFFSIASMPEDKRSARWQEDVIPRLREKGSSKGMLKSY
jgi:hypothetical protein